MWLFTFVFCSASDATVMIIIVDVTRLSQPGNIVTVAIIATTSPGISGTMKISRISAAVAAMAWFLLL